MKWRKDFDGDLVHAATNGEYRVWREKGATRWQWTGPGIQSSAPRQRDAKARAEAHAMAALKARREAAS